MVYLRPWQTSVIEPFVKLANGLTIFVKSSIANVWQGLKSGFKLEIQSWGRFNGFVKVIMQGCKPFHMPKAR